MRATVIGAGVIGLTSALRLVQRGAIVTVLSADAPDETTSTVAGGLVYPRHAEPADDCARWTEITVARFKELAGQDETGVRLMPGRLLRREQRPLPMWSRAVGGIAQDTGVDDPWRDVLRFSTTLVDTGRYLAWLTRQLIRAGVRMERVAVRQFSDVADYDVLVNAAGLGAGRLAADSAVQPARGQVVHLADPGLDEWVVDEDGFSYVLPHGGHVVCGGTEEHGNSSLEPDDLTTADILRRCERLVPELAGQDIVDVRVGLRPYRPAIRLERDGDVIHCYGHGGVGITVSWGCAEDVAALAGA